MRKRFLCLLLVISAILAISAHAASARTIDVYPSLAFNGTSATCTVTILGERTTDRISAVMELWQGNILIDDWSASASGILKIDETTTVAKNKTYTLTVEYLSLIHISEPTRP